jgi:2,3-diaminopropionate biosynthesis protein SbnA
MNPTQLDGARETPLVSLRRMDLGVAKVLAKLELQNPTGSVKDRAAAYVLGTIIERSEIEQDTVILESSSGNFGIALAACAKRYGLSFTCVVDPDITSINDLLLRHLDARVVRVHALDEASGYVGTRLRRVQELHAQIPNSYWVNQSENPLNAEAYYRTLGAEVCRALDRIDYVFIAVSSGATITGVSQRVKEQFPDSTIVAVDMEGSAIFGQTARRCRIPAIGSSVVPPILRHARIDDVVHVSECETIDMCHALLRKEAIFAGGSSGAVLAGIRKYFVGRKPAAPPTVVTILADRGERYIDTIYDSDWCERIRSERARARDDGYAGLAASQ